MFSVRNVGGFPPVLGPLGVSPDPSAVPSGPAGVSWIPRVPSGPSGVPLDPPPPRVLRCPWCLLGPAVVYNNSLVRPAAAAPPLLVPWCPPFVASVV
jgi:hypothetical protein